MHKGSLSYSKSDDIFVVLVLNEQHKRMETHLSDNPTVLNQLSLQSHTKHK